MTDTRPVWTPYDPDTVIGEFGWLWIYDSPEGPRWTLIQTTEDDGDGLIAWMVGDGDGETSDAPGANGYRGNPYISASAPGAEPGKCDALEVTIRLPGGASVAHAFGHGQTTDRIDASLRAILNFGSRNTAAIDVLAERRRQIEGEGWTREHDDMHDPGALAGAGARYAWDALDDAPSGGVPLGWPFDPEWWKPSSPRRNLVKAAALILAEIEKLDREEARDG